MKYLKATKQPHKSYLYWTAPIMLGQDKALWKEPMRTIISQNGTLILPIGKCTRAGHTQQRILMAPEKGLLHMNLGNWMAKIQLYNGSLRYKM